VNAINIARLKIFPGGFMNISMFWGATPSGLVSVSLSIFFLEYPEYWAVDFFETLINWPIYSSVQSVNGEEGYTQVVSCKMKISVVVRSLQKGLKTFNFTRSLITTPA
jgi:hypothetical protein